MIEEYKSKSVAYVVLDEDDGHEVFNLENDFSEEIQFRITGDNHYFTIDTLKEIKKCIDKAIREANKEF